MQNKRKLIIDIEKRTVDKRTGHISFQFTVGPFKKTMATTVGSALRRNLLSLSRTIAITSICGDFSGGNSLREDFFELSLNFQRVQIKSPFFPYVGLGRIQKKGPAVITAQDLELENGLEVVNPYQYICTLNSSYNLNLQVMIRSPNTNKGLDHINSLNSLKKSSYSALKAQEGKFANILNTTISDSNSKLPTRAIEKKKKIFKTENIFKKIKNDKAKIKVPQKLPLDFVIVDPIYSSIQSCGFEVIQTISSSMKEYEQLTTQGITDTEEFLKFVIISRGAIEPVVAIEFALKELNQNLSILEPLPHVFACKKNVLLSLEKGTRFIQTKKIRKNVVNSYTLELVKKLDLKHLKLPPMLELFLRQEGFVTLQNLISVPLEFFKRIGLNQSDMKKIENSLNHFGLSMNFQKTLAWDLIPNSIPI